jgi:hypothetical protein
MILPDFILQDSANKICNYSGIDSPSGCLDKKHFDNYPYLIDYRYNSRGFRDAEWPELSELVNSIWCVGDSFTAGLGAPYNHIWPVVLKSGSKKNTINVSMDGASNDWISRKILRILDTLSPKNIVVQWSYFSRLESTDVTLSDEDRRKQFDYNKLFLRNEFNNFKKNFLLVESAKLKTKTNIIHSFVPNASSLVNVTNIWNGLKGPNWPKYSPKTHKDLHSLEPFIINELIDFDQFENIEIYPEYCKLLNTAITITYSQIDRARDGFHYDIKTATKIVNEILPLLE